jgi:hypothetical protein
VHAAEQQAIATIANADAKTASIEVDVHT